MRSRWFGGGAGTLLGGIRVRLIGMILLVALPLIAVQGFELYSERERDIAAAHARALDIARRGGEQYRSTIAEVKTLLETLSLVPEVAGSADTCAAFLQKAGERLAWAGAFWVIGPDGRAVCATVPGGVGLDLSDRDYFVAAMASREFAVSDFFTGRLTGRATSMATLPVLDANGNVARILAISLRLSWFTRLVAEVGTESGARVMLYDRQGTLLARYPDRPEWVGRNWRGHALMERIEAAREGVAELTAVDGTEQIYGWSEIPGSLAHIAVGFDRTDVLEAVNGQTRKGALALLIAMALATLASVPLARGVVRPLKLLTAGAERARNSASASLPKVRGYAEVASLATSLDALLADRRRREEALVEARGEAERAAGQARDAHARLTSALEMLPEGIVIFDADDRFLLWNQRYAEFYSTDRELTRGERFEDRLRKSVANGRHPGALGREEAWIAERLHRHAQPESVHEQQLAGGRWLRVEERRMADGGTIGVRVDITELKQREELFRLLFQNNPVPMWVYDRETFRFLAVNDAALAHYGYSRARFLAMTILDIRPPEDRDEVVRVANEGSESSGSRGWRHLKADGTAIEVTAYTRKLEHAGRAAKLVAIIDLTERKRAEDELRRTRTFLDTVVENIPAMLFVKDAREHRYVLFNRAGEEFLGMSRQHLIGKTDRELFPERKAERIMACDRRVLQSRELQVIEEEQIATPHSGLRLLRTKKIAITDESGAPQYLLGISEDITERKRAEARITHMAHHDAMTGLANRALFRQRLEQAVQEAGERKAGLAVLYVDLDGFKEVNDALGHPVGDALLRFVATRLKSCVRDVDTVARLGGDEFAVIQTGIAAREDAGRLAARLVDLIGQPYHVEGKDVVVSASVGIATAPHDGEDPEGLLKFADLALYSAKTEGGRAIRFFEPAMNSRLQARRALERDLRAAFGGDEFVLHYQPSIDLSTGTVSGFEALLRWSHPQRGPIPPAEFIPIAEDIGLIEQLGEWVLRQACAEAARWPAHVRVAVNLSPAQFKSPNIVQAVLLALASAGLPAHRLELEITESVLLQENETNLATLHRLRGLGTRIALDDFGIGYSSLSYLRMFPFDKIKVDRSFVKELPDNRECAMIIRAMVGLARGLNMETTAEGIETPEQLAHLRADGCTEAQGFLISRPRPADEVHELIARHGRAAGRAA